MNREIAFYAREYFGIEIPPKWDENMVPLLTNFNKAMLIVAGADGEISPQEWEWFYCTRRLLGYPEEMLASLREFDFRNAKLEDYLSGYPVGLDVARGLLFGAICMASADGYVAEERAALARVAAQLGVDSAIVATLESMAEMETSLRALKRRMFMPAMPAGQST
jgi:tellurite resistance protein